MIQKIPRHAELFGKLRGKRFHAERLRRVMAAVKNVQAQFLRHSKRPVRTFTGDERVHTLLSRALEFVARVAGHDADAFANIFPAGNEQRLYARRAVLPSRQIVP